MTRTNSNSDTPSQSQERANSDQLPPLNPGLAMVGLFQPSVARGGLVRSGITILQWRRIARLHLRGQEVSFEQWQSDMRRVEVVVNGARVRAYEEVVLTEVRFLADFQIFQNENIEFMASLEGEHIEQEANPNLLEVPVVPHWANISPPAILAPNALMAEAKEIPEQTLSLR